jgi:hypothetical protein
MIVSSQKLRRLGRAARKTTSGGTTLEELIRAAPDGPRVQAKWTRREATAAAAAEKAALLPQPTEATTPPAEARPAAPPPPAPGMPPAEPRWHEEMLGWRSHGTPPPPQGEDDVRYETIHEYDPLERALEENYDPDS